MVDLKKYVQSGGTKKMKKSLLILGALAAMSMIFMGCPNSSTSDPTEGKTTATVTSTYNISIAKNYTWTAEGTQDATTFSNWQTSIDAISDWTPAVGDVIRITFSGTASSAIKCIQANIVDNTQAFYDLPVNSIDTFYSCRKFFGVPDGAYLYCDRQLDMELEEDQSWQRMDYLLKRIDVSPESAYADFKVRSANLHNMIVSCRVRERDNDMHVILAMLALAVMVEIVFTVSVRQLQAVAYSVAPVADHVLRIHDYSPVL